ncbi:hypothetical protein GJ744_005933 [Endocarpon pusillum]|uniref:Azaphilone pigments biosynthesis cluster protein L N-terminal domain-containing protein n=1 Tax=Endocarpon pusillum TaxID=364733 RepID=A0A8H7AKJ2_9EURO|nr:hypothetical protein GJ744_005933 [Endocarpon pusillum]
MDPLSITASILTILGAAGQVKKGLERLQSLKSAPQELCALTNEIADLQVVLNNFSECLSQLQTQKSLEEDWVSSVQRPLGRAQNLIKELNVLIETKLTATKCPNEKGMPQVVRLSWTKEKKNLARFQKQLRETRVNLILALMTTNIHISSELRQHLTQIPLIIQGISFTKPSPEALTAAPDDIQLVHRKLDQILTTITNTSHEPSHPISALVPANTLQGEISDSQKANDANGTTKNLDQYTLSITTSSIKAKCDRFCRCQCHTITSYRTPRWMKSFIGILYFGYSGTPLLNRRPCNYSQCRESGRPTTNFTYHFPRWAVSRVLSLTGRLDDLSGLGASWTIRIPRVIRPNAHIWWQISVGSIIQVQNSFAKGLASPFDVNPEGDSLLNFAIEHLRPDMCALLLDVGADKYSRSNAGLCALDQVCQMLLERPQDESHPTVGELKALFYNDSAFDYMNFTILHRIVVDLSSADLSEQLEVNDSIINIPDALGRTPLHWVARRGDLPKVEILLNWAAQPNVMDNQARTPLHEAAYTGTTECVVALLEAGADVKARDVYGRTALHEVLGRWDAQEEMIESLVHFGGDVNAKDNDGRFPLHMSTWIESDGHLQNTIVFLKHGADIDAQDGYEETLAVMAVYNKNAKLLQLLMSHGAKLDLLVGFKRRTILHYAAGYGSSETMEVLTEANIKVVDVDAIDVDGNTASYYFENLRDDMFLGERAPVEEERAAFEALLESVGAGFIREDWDDEGSQYESCNEERLHAGVPENE